MDLRINSTGIRNGEFIIGIGKQNKGSILKINGFYPPSEEHIKMLSNTDVRDKFRNIEFFENMDVEERLAWLDDNKIDDDKLYLGDAREEISATVIKIGGKFMVDHFSDMDMDQTYTIRELEEFIPRKPNSRAKHHTLLFRPSNWELFIEEKITFWDGVYFDLDNLTIEDSEIDIDDEEEECEITVLERLNDKSTNMNLAIISSGRSKQYTYKELYTIMPEKYVEGTKIAVKQLEIFNQSPAFFKSLLQKLIRTRAINCDIDGVNVKSEEAILAIICTLLIHPGAFVPNIQRFVSGMESIFKRLGVSTFEDSWTDDHETLLGLFICAALSQRNPNWIPNPDIIKKMFTFAIKIQKESKRFKWKIVHNKKFNFDTENLISGCFILLEQIKSFSTDIEMVKYISSTGGEYDKTYNNNGETEFYKAYQAIDHHTNPEVAHFFEYPKWNISYPDLFKIIWDTSSRYNPRRKDDPDFNLDDYKDIRLAQELFTMAKYKNIEKRYRERIRVKDGKKDEKVIINFDYDLDPSWLAGLIGPIQVDNAFVVLRTDDISSFTAIKKPSRNSKSPDLTETEKSAAIIKAKMILLKGVKLSNCPEILNMFKSSIVKFNPETEMYKIKIGSEFIPWEEACLLRSSVPLHKKLKSGFEKDIINAIKTTGKGVCKNHETHLNKLISNTEIEVLRRLYTIISGMATKITLGKIGRDGVGIDYTVNVYDSAIFQFLCSICNLYPAGLELKKLSFHIKDGPIFWFVRDKILASLSLYTNENKEESKLWNVNKDKRKLWEHQIDIVNTMIQRSKEGKRGHLIWMKMGYGKSMCVTQYIHRLIEMGKMTKYCIWSLPPSAMKSVEREILTAGLKCNIIDSRYGKNNEIVENVVNLIKQDHLRLHGFDLKVRKIANDCIFIADEFHKAMSKTKRTSIILDIIKLSHDFIGLSGTLIKDSNTDELIAWLQQIVEFEVTEKNYWVAVGALISRKVETKVVLDRTFHESKMPENYYKLVPKSLGGTSNTIKFREALDMSYSVIVESLIDSAFKYLELGKKVFIVAKDKKDQNYIADSLSEYNVFKISSDNTIVLAPGDKTDIDVVITTIYQAEGYTLSLLHVGLTGCWFSNYATREQLEGRLNRLNQENDVVTWETHHAGILSYTLEKYENTRNLSQALKGFAELIDVDLSEIRKSIKK